MLVTEFKQLFDRYLGSYERAVAQAYESAVLEVFSTFTIVEVYTERKRLGAEVNTKSTENLAAILCKN